MFEALSRYLCARNKTDSNAFLSAEWAVFDWSGAGIHTGSRLGEYGQSKPTEGSPFCHGSYDLRMLANGQVLPLAFIRADFTFYDSGMLRRPISECLADESLAARSCMFASDYDKSKNNFTIRKYRHVLAASSASLSAPWISCAVRIFWASQPTSRLERIAPCYLLQANSLFWMVILCGM